MRTIAIQKGNNYIEHNGPVHHDGKFWWAEVKITEESGPIDTSVANSDGLVYRMPYHGRLVVAGDGRLIWKQYAGTACLVEDVKTTVDFGLPPEPPRPEWQLTPQTWWDSPEGQAWIRWSNLRHKIYHADARKDNVRIDYNDTHIVMTGMGATKQAPILMGPTNAEVVTKVKGINKGHIVIYHRGWGVRVMKLSKEHNPIGVLLAEDGQTAAAFCSQMVFIVDVDQ